MRGWLDTVMLWKSSLEAQASRASAAAVALLLCFCPVDADAAPRTAVPGAGG